MENLESVTSGAPEVVFRRARQDDVAAIVALLADDELGRDRETVSDPPLEAYLRAFERIAADPDHHLLAVGARDGVVVATLHLVFLPGLSHRGAERAQVEAVRVAAGKRGAGIGRELMGWAIARAAERGCRLVQLTTDRRRVRAQRFYESLGFVASHLGMKLPLAPSPAVPRGEG